MVQEKVTGKMLLEELEVRLQSLGSDHDVQWYVAFANTKYEKLTPQRQESDVTHENEVYKIAVDIESEVKSSIAALFNDPRRRLLEFLFEGIQQAAAETYDLLLVLLPLPVTLVAEFREKIAALTKEDLELEP